MRTDPPRISGRHEWLDPACAMQTARFLLLLACVPAPAAAQAAPAESWPAYGPDPQGTRLSPLTDITPANVGQLGVARRYRTGEADVKTGRPTSLEATPIVVDGTLYFNTPLGRVIALDPETGAERWVFDAKVDRNSRFGDWVARGVSTWLDQAAPTGADSGTGPSNRRNTRRPRRPRR